MLAFLLGEFTIFGLIELTLKIWAFLFTIAVGKQLYENENDRKFWASFISQGSFGGWYSTYMKRFLDWLDAKLSVHEIETRQSEWARAWSLGLFKFWSGIAIVYPLTMLLIQWVLFNKGDLNGITIFESTLTWQRLGVFFALILFVYNIRSYTWVKSRLGFVVLISSIVFIFIFAFGAAFAVTVAVAVAVSISVAFSFAFAGTFVFVGPVAGTFSVAVAFTFAYAFARTYERFEKRQKKYGCFSAATFGHYLLIVFTAVATVIVFLPEIALPSEGREDPRGVILFLCLLPIANALFDFFSIGLTRYCLRRGLSGPTFVWVIADTIGGVVLFFALGVTLIVLLHFVRPEDGVPILDVPALFDDLQTRDGAWRDYIWLFLMAFTTILPTLLHASFGLLGVFVTVPNWLSTRIVKWLDESGAEGGTKTMGLCASGVIALILAVSFTVPLWLAYIFFHAFDWAVLHRVLAAFVWFSDLWVGVYWPA